MSELDRIIDRRLSWEANQIVFEQELEEFLSHCPNMTGEDDLRDICKGRCPLYKHYCISIEPSEEDMEI